ncbi:MAG: hypothetical protein GF403_09655 [Candidatus Coatesbacteria bacterium]|nr:hypothetical protein [Candidatus Coatesbacteria bacterium]
MRLQELIRRIGDRLAEVGAFIEGFFRPLGRVFAALRQALRWLSRGPRRLAQWLHEHWPDIRKSLNFFGRAYSSSFNASAVASRDARRSELRRRSDAEEPTEKPKPPPGDQEGKP